MIIKKKTAKERILQDILLHFLRKDVKENYTCAQILEFCYSNDIISIIVNRKFSVVNWSKGNMGTCKDIKYYLLAMPCYISDLKSECDFYGRRVIKIYIESQKLEEKILEIENEWYKQNSIYLYKKGNKEEIENASEM